jgi:hypothetical protein
MYLSFAKVNLKQYYFMEDWLSKVSEINEQCEKVWPSPTFQFLINQLIYLMVTLKLSVI